MAVGTASNVGVHEIGLVETRLGGAIAERSGGRLMGDATLISWADKTFNPWIGCQKVGPGCDHCYAEAQDHRFGGDHWGPGKERRLTKTWDAPRKWNREAERTGVSPWVFCASMADVFDNEVPAEWRERLWQLVRETPHLRWIFVTKRIGNAARMLPPDWPEAFGHCGLCSTIVNQAEADRDVPKLLATPAAWRGVSAEPLLGPIDFTHLYDAIKERMTDALDGMTETGVIDAGHRFVAIDPTYDHCAKLDWIIVGGESGHGARPMHPQWARDIRDQCAAAGVSFHFKQWGEFVSVSEQSGEGRHHQFDDGATVRRIGKMLATRTLDGVEHNGMPPSPAVCPALAAGGAR